MMCKMKKQAAPLLVLLAILLITTLEMAPEVASGDGGGKLVCNAELLQCEGACHKSVKCMRCCRHYGYTHGQCSMKHGQGCYCCATVAGAGEQQQRMLRVIPASPPPPSYS